MKRIPGLTLLGFMMSCGVRVWSAEGEVTNPPVRLALGEEVRLEDHLIPGKTVIFEFTSPFCGPCKVVAPLLEQYARERDDVVVVVIDINRPRVEDIDWQSPVALQHGIRYVPQFKVFGADGQLVAERHAADDLVLKQWLNFSWPDD